jgi:hypothetical protein
MFLRNWKLRTYMNPGDRIEILLADGKSELRGVLIEMNHEGVLFWEHKPNEETFIPYWNIQAVEKR